MVSEDAVTTEAAHDYFTNYIREVHLSLIQVCDRCNSEVKSLPCQCGSWQTHGEGTDG